METIVLVVHLLLAIALIAVVLMQKSEGGALGIGGGGGNMMSVRGTGNLLTRLTGWLAAGFICTSLTLAILASGSGTPGSILDTAPLPASGAILPAEEPAAPAAPVAPTAPLGE